MTLVSDNVDVLAIIGLVTSAKNGIFRVYDLLYRDNDPSNIIIPSIIYYTKNILHDVRLEISIT